MLWIAVLAGARNPNSNNVKGLCHVPKSGQVVLHPVLAGSS